MLVSEYVEQIISTRPYKYSTRQTNIRDIKRLGIWNKEISEINSALIRDIVEKVPNQNSRKRLFITARSLFRDLGILSGPPLLRGNWKNL